MTIDHTSLGGFEIFPFSANWKSPPKITLTPKRTIIGFPGTSQDILSLITGIPTEITVDIVLDSRQLEKQVFDFFDDRKGRWEKFWIKKPILNYTLHSMIPASSTTIQIKSTGFDTVFKGTERIFLHHLNGNSCIKKITDVVKYTSPDYLLLTVDSAITDEWVLNDPQMIMGQLKLVRFDQDNLSVDYTTDTYATVSFKMIELLYDYSEL